jgi:predicted phage terminase large subunit-like protein
MSAVEEVIDELALLEVETLEKPKKVVDYLNELSYKVDPEYVPSPFAIEFVNFIKLVNGETGEENTTPVCHYKMLDTLIYRDAGKDVLNMCHRGLAKTTIFGEYLILFIAVYNEIPGFGKVPYGLYVSDSIENGVKKMRLRLERRRENSQFLLHYIPFAKFTDIRWYFKNRSNIETVFTGHGAKTGVRGTVELNTRPVLAILDDLISDEDARSATVIASVEDTVYKAIAGALHPTNRLIIWSGTPFNAKDPLYKAVESGAWEVNVFPVCEEFPVKRKDFRGSWEDRFTYDSVLRAYKIALKLGKVDAFNQELMLRIMSEDERLIPDNNIRWYPLENVMRYPSAYNWYITTDFATSEKDSADFSVISVWAYNSNGDWFWVDGICAKQLMDKNMDDLFRLAQRYRPESVGIEVTGQQKGFIPWIQAEMSNRNIWFNLASDKKTNEPGIRPAIKKIDRFHVVQPWFQAGKVYFPTDKKHSPPMIQCMDELELVTRKEFKSKHDDFSDTISMLADMQAWKPSADVRIPTKGRDYWGDEVEPPEDNALSNYIV